MANVLKFQPLSDLNKMLVIRAGIHKMHVRIANREDPESWVFTVCQLSQIVLEI